MKTFKSNSPEQTLEIAQELASSLKGNETILLHGDLGSGKTLFTKGIASHYGIPSSEVKSPTYTILREYKLQLPHLKKIIHVDLYRLSIIDDITAETLETYFDQPQTLTIIEWPDRLTTSPNPHHSIKIEHDGEKNRLINWINNE